MPNRQVFRTNRTGRRVTRATGQTSEGIKAYAIHPEQALAELACVGTFRNTYYDKADVQIQTLIELSGEVSDEFLARLAIYSREKGHMKDMPAAILAVLATRNTELFNRIFHRVIDNVRMIRGFVQIMRSGAVGRKSLGSAPKKRVQEAIQRLKPFLLLNGSVGKDPSLADVIKMVHPKPITTNHMSKDEMKNAFAWIIGKEWDYDHLPRIFQEYEAFKESSDYEAPRVNFRLIDGLPTMTDEHWRDLGYSMNWTTLRMNLRTLARHGVMDDALATHAAKVLADRDNVQKSKCFPYQIKTAYDMTRNELPQKVTNALQDALDIAVENVPALPGRVLVLVDISGSMTCSVGGGGGDWSWGYYDKSGHSSKTTCMDAACLFGAVVFKQNEDAVVKAFATHLYHPRLNPRDSVASITDKIQKSGQSSGTNFSAGMQWALQNREKFDAVVWFSDMQANLSERAYDDYRGTSTAHLIDQYRNKINRDVKIITCNLAANRGFSQVDGEVDPNVLQIAGFSDRVFEVVSSFLEAHEPGHWVKVVESIEI